MARQEKFKHKFFFSALWPLLFPLLCTVHQQYASTKPPHLRKHLLNHKEQHSPSTNKTTP